MRRFLPLVALAAGGLLLVGCAQTDYLNAPFNPNPNRSHGVIDCRTDDKVANTQQTFERDLQTNLDMVSGCSWPGCTVLGPVTSAFAKQFRFVGPWHFNTEVKVGGSGAFAGHWAMSAVHPMRNGDRVVFTFYRPITSGGWSCPASGYNGRYGGPFGSGIQPQTYQGGNWTGWGPESVALDTASGPGWGGNIVAATPLRSGAGYQTFMAQYGRAYEGRLHRVPITRYMDGLAEFFAGSPIKVSHAGFEVEVSGSVRDDGMIVATFHSISYGDSTFTPSSPIEVVANRDVKLIEYDLDGQLTQSLELAEWALENAPMDQAITVGGFIPELGIQPHERDIYLVSATIEDWLVQNTGSINPRERDRLR